MTRRLAILCALPALAATTATAAAHVPPLPAGLAGGDAAPQAPPPLPDSCPDHVAQTGFPTAAALAADNERMVRFGARPTASPAHTAFVNWLERRSAGVPGVTVRSVPYTIDRWLETGSSLAAGQGDSPLVSLQPSGAVPYAHATGPRGVTAPLVYVPAERALAGEEVTGRLVIRDVVPGRTPYRNYNVVQWFKHDPDLSLTRAEAGGEASESDATGANRRIVEDLSAASEAGAAGVIFVHGFPREQVAGHYAPYEGFHWKLPALYVGADEGAHLKQLAQTGGRARIAVLATRASRAETRMLVATLPGASAERMVIQSHTDGINALWDNGPIAMLALMRHFAALPQECRPRTLQFVFTTAHLYQHLAGELGPKGGSAADMAEQLDREYDEGTVAMVLALEHLGAREYEARPRAGGPGRELVPTGRSEVNTFFAGESPAIVEAAARAIVRRDLARTYVLRGADAPGARVPIHQSFGGEGNPYHQRLVPTFAFITGPWTLFKPTFGMEAIDPELMRNQSLVFADVIQELADVPGPALGGGYVAERGLRSVICGSALAALGFMTCNGGAGE